MPEAKHNPTKRTAEELFEDAQQILDKIVRNALRPWNRHLHSDDINRFKQRLVLLMLQDNKKMLAEFRQEAELSTWLQQVANHEVSRQLRPELRNISFEDLQAEALKHSPLQEKLLLQKEQRNLLKDAISKLTSYQQQMALLLMQGLTAEDIAHLLGIKVNSVYRIKHTVVAKLKEIINGKVKIIFF